MDRALCKNDHVPPDLWILSCGATCVIKFMIHYHATEIIWYKNTASEKITFIEGTRKLMPKIALCAEENGEHFEHIL